MPWARPGRFVADVAIARGVNAFEPGRASRG